MKIEATKASETDLTVSTISAFKLRIGDEEGSAIIIGREQARYLLEALHQFSRYGEILHED